MSLSHITTSSDSDAEIVGSSASLVILSDTEEAVAAVPAIALEIALKVAPESEAVIGFVGIKSFLMMFGITTVLIDVNAAQSKLVLLENFNENYSKCLRLLCKVTTAEGVNAASEKVSTAELDKDFVITALKNELRKLKGKELANNVVTKPPIDPEMLKIDVEHITPRLLNNRTAHSDYFRHTQEQAAILREIVEQGKSQNPLNNSLDSACKYTKRIQELLIIIRQTCPSINNSSDKLVAVTPKNKDKRVRFTEPVTSSGNTNTKTASSSNLVSNKPMLSSTGVKPSTSASGSQPSGNTKKDKIQQTPSSTQKNKVEAHPRTCNGCMLSDNHDLCVLNFINDVNARVKSKSVKKSSKRKVWKPTGKVFTNIGYTWRPTGRTFTIVGNACPLTRITTTAEVPLRKPTTLESDIPKPVVTLVYSRKPRKSKTNVPVSKPKIIKSISANKKEPSKSWGSIVSDVPSSTLDECRSSKCTVKFGNDHVAKILEYGDYQIGNVTISWVYYVEGLGHNFSTYHFSTYLVHFVIRQMIARTWKLQPKAGIGIFIGYAPRGGARISS
ncbi:hypothetical protein Tco_0503545 [Tanacetum coccineum]